MDVALLPLREKNFLKIKFVKHTKDVKGSLRETQWVKTKEAVILNGGFAE